MSASELSGTGTIGLEWPRASPNVVRLAAVEVWTVKLKCFGLPLPRADVRKCAAMARVVTLKKPRPNTNNRGLSQYLRQIGTDQVAAIVQLRCVPLRTVAGQRLPPFHHTAVAT